MRASGASKAGTVVSSARSTSPFDAMDLLIATAAVLDASPLVTRNTRHFQKGAVRDLFPFRCRSPDTPCSECNRAAGRTRLSAEGPEGVGREE